MSGLRLSGNQQGFNTFTVRLLCKIPKNSLEIYCLNTQSNEERTRSGHFHSVGTHLKSCHGYFRGSWVGTISTLWSTNEEGLNNALAVPKSA